MRWIGVAMLWLGACATGGADIAAPTSIATLRPQVEVASPRFIELIPERPDLTVVVDGYRWLEGPIWHPGRRELLFSSIPDNAIVSWDPRAGERVWLDRSGYTGAEPFTGPEPGSNGLALDPEGRVVVCQHGDRRIVRLDERGRMQTLVSHYEGKRLNSPNDAVFAGNGDLYFTDPPFGLPATYEDPAKELSFSGVYRLSAAGELTLLTRDLRGPNGIALSPDERTLYVSDVDPSRPGWWAFPIEDSGELGEGRMFAGAEPWQKRRRGGPDGIEVDEQGNLFAAGPEGVYVFDPDGAFLGALVTGIVTSNLGWGEDGSTLFVTSSDRVLRLRVNARGAHYEPASPPEGPDFVISANDSKFVRDAGRATYPPNPVSETATLLDAATTPATVVATVPVRHTIHGPPQSAAVTADGRLGFVSAPDRYDHGRGVQTKLDTLQVVDFTLDPPKVTARIDVGAHPQGLALTPDERLLLAATAGGTVAVLTIDEQTAQLTSTLALGKGKLAGVAVTADGRSAIVANRDEQGLSVLDIEGTEVRFSGERIASGVTPYAVDVSADGRLAVVSNVGLAAIDDRIGTPVPDADTLTLIDTSERPFRAVQHLTVPSIPEGVAISPDGRFIVANCMDGSNLGPEAFGHQDQGTLVLFEVRHGRAFELDRVPGGTASQGVAFTSDSERVLVQFNVEKEIATYQLVGGSLADTGHRIPLTGGPTSLRTAPRRAR